MKEQERELDADAASAALSSFVAGRLRQAPNISIETCERCQMKLPESWGTFVAGVRGSTAWRCAACLPTAGKEGEREEIIKIRKATR